MEPVKKTFCDLCAHLPICKHAPQESCPHIELKEPQTPKIEKPQPKQKRSAWRTIWISFLWLLVFVALALSFVAGRLSLHPWIVSKLPAVSRPVPSGSSPEEVVRQFFLAAREHDTQKLIACAHPDLMKTPSDLNELIDRGPALLSPLKELQIVDLTIEERAGLGIILLMNDGQADSGEISLKREQGEWKILNFDW
jgi:hypothetical protein